MKRGVTILVLLFFYMSVNCQLLIFEVQQLVAQIPWSHNIRIIGKSKNIEEVTSGKTSTKQHHV
jgi:hypothetical protein